MQINESAFRKFVIEDPLFASEGLDIENARGALDELEKSVRGVEREYARGSWKRKLFLTRYPLTQYAVPFLFMRAFLKSEELRRAYLLSPTSASASALAEAWICTAARISADISRYKVLHTTLVRLESTEDSFVMQDSYGFRTSYSFVKKMMRSFEENATALTEEARHRAWVLSGKERALFSQIPDVAVPILKQGAISPWHSELLDAAIKYGTWPFRYVDIAESYGPLTATCENFDGVPRERTFMLYLTKEKDTSLNSMWIALVDRFYFLDIWNFVPKDEKVVRAKYATAVGLQKDEIPYWYEAATNLYGSRDSTYWMDVATAVDVVRRPELDLKLIARQRSSMWDMLLVECARDIRILSAHLRRRVRSETSGSYSLLYDLLTRSYPGIYYLPFNASVWRIAERPHLLGERFVPPDQKKNLSEEQIQSVMTPQMLATVMSAAKLREERGREAGWLD